MLLKIIALTLLGQLSNLLRRKASQKKISESGAINWKGWSWFLKANGRAIALWLVAYITLYLIMGKLINSINISNYAELWTFGPFQVKAGILYEVMVGLAAWGFGVAGSDYVLNLLGRSSSIILEEINKKTPNNRGDFTNLPDELTPPTP